ncbi:NADH-quinone oxidoreductase subunit K [Streptomyces sp. NP160]|uniref:NADH-quinone oxidoreductase subunit K n=1 Tax=Streptomyces sp. NP160 TaxID=2586637 RepID=UPI001C58F662|nr:NADH-quinone oxidoreductase subunit K [Streptomyces sp. NP160]
MSPTIVLTVAVGGLVATGVYLLTSRHLTRVVLGVLVAGNGVNLLLIAAAGRAGRAPVLDPDGEITLETAAESSDPLPQALVLTAIVITFAVTAFLLAMAYRTSRIEGTKGDDVVRDTSPQGRSRGEAAPPGEASESADSVDGPDGAPVARGAESAPGGSGGPVLGAGNRPAPSSEDGAAEGARP